MFQCNTIRQLNHCLHFALRRSILSMAKSTKPDSFVNVYGWAAYRISAGRCSMSHSHHGCGGHHHHDEQQDPAVLWSLYKKIDLHKVQCMNESEDGSGKEVFKAWERRLDRDKVSSDVR